MSAAATELVAPSVLRERIECLGALGLSGVQLVAQGDAIHFAGAVGFADRVDRVPLRPDSILDVGSLSKQFTAAAILLLAQRGQLDVHDPVARFFDAVPAEKADITLHHLLTHSSGLRYDHFDSDFDQLGSDEALERIFALPIRSAPGAEYAYSNAGYSLLGLVVERVGGSDYRSFVREQLFAPAGLASTGWYGDAHLPASAWARGYAGTWDYGSPREWPQPAWALLANGGVCSSARDLHRWVRALDEGRVLDAQTREQMWTHVIGGYGYGWDVGTTSAGRRRVGHTGAGLFGFSAIVHHFPDLAVTSILLTNASYRGHHLIETQVQHLVEAIFEDVPFPLELPRLVAGDAGDAGAQPSCGVYASEPDGARFEIWSEAGRPVIGARDQSAADVLSGRPGFAGEERLEAATLAVVAALAEQRDDAIDEHAAEAESVPQLREIVRETWTAVTAGLPVVGEAAYLGLVPTVARESLLVDVRDRDAATVTSLVRVATRQGPVCLRLVWSQAGLLGTETAAAAPRGLAAHMLAPTRAGHVGVDLFSGRRIEVEARDGGLTLTAGDRTLTLSPEEPPCR